MQKVVLVFVVCIAGGPGCAAQSSLSKRDASRLQQRVDELRARNRAQRGQIRDLENRVFLLRDRLETAEVEGARVGDKTPRLPVEVREPESADSDSSPDYKVVGVDSQGNEIVYVGDAATDRVVRPPLPGSDEPEPGASAPSMRRRTRRPAVGSVPVTSDRIPTGGPRHLPTVQNQLRRVARAPAAPIPRSADDAKSEYQRHYRALRAGRHREAIAGFRRFVRRHPNHDYADNAQYWLGEAYYDQKQYRRARVEFRKVITAYPRGNKLPDALLKLGFCYLSLNQIPKARAVLRQVATIYPRTPAAKLASARLATLK